MWRRQIADGPRWASLRADFLPRALVTTLGTGLVMGMVNALLTVALMSLIFSGELKEFLPMGIGVGLVASGAIALVTGLLSGFPGMFAGVQDNSSAILGLAAASLAGSLSSPGVVTTVLATMATTSLATGVVFILMGTFRLGEIAKFVPFPVVGGLLAGTGYLILRGSVEILTGGATDDVTSSVAVGLLMPGLALGLCLFMASRLQWAARTYLLFIVAGIGFFHLITLLAGVDLAESLSRGWLLGRFSGGELWPGVVAETFLDANWSAVVGEAGNLLTILFIVPLTLLLYISAIEIGTKRDLDLNAELRTTGWANLASGVVGGPPGYLYLGDTLVSYRLVGGRRGATVVAALGLLGVVLVGGSVLEFLPQFVIGGLLLYFGLEFVYEWLWEARRRMSRLDYALMLAIVVVIALIGFLPGVAVGLAAALVLFVYRYSTVDVVKHQLSARERPSNIERPLDHSEVLDRLGNTVLVMELQGFIFFGTANRILERVKTRLASTDPLRFVVFDFRLVTGVDSSAVASFERIALLARDHNLILVFTGLGDTRRSQFSGPFSSFPDVVRQEPDLDRGMAWCEDLLLKIIPTDDGGPRTLPDGLADQLSSYLQRRSIPAGERLMTEGDPSPGMFLIMSGRATVLLEGDHGEEMRLRTLLEGTVLGEISLYRGEPCTATVMTDTTCEVLHLSPEAFSELCARDPVAAASLHAFVARTLAGRVSHANRTIRALQE